MCGIAGYIGRRPIDERQIAAALSAMKSRGPDHQAARTFNTHSGCLALLHSRLSIIDLDARSNQPFVIGSLHIIFNGEIYNYRELRHELEQEGVEFTTTSDTEVLLRYYQRHGREAFARFEGMWALAIYDASQGTLLLSRDRFGEKPLYYVRRADGFYFASEIRILEALIGARFAINELQLKRYLVYGFRSLCTQDLSFLAEVSMFPAGSLAEVRIGDVGASGPLSSCAFWQIPTPTKHSAQEMSFVDAVDGVRERLAKSLELRLRADVPLAFCLSGGMDSSSLVSLAVRAFGLSPKTYSIIDSDPRYDERRNIQILVDELKCESHLVEIGTDGFFDRMRRLIRYHRSPIATISYYVHSFLSEAIAKDGIRVVLSGTGADEIFTGYYDHFLFHLSVMQGEPEFEALRSDWERHIRPFVRSPELRDVDRFLSDSRYRDHLRQESGLFSECLLEPFAEEFFEERYCENGLRNRMLNELFHEIVPVILIEDDLNSMACSLENRSPFLDSELLKFVMQVPDRHLIGDGFAKRLLRESMKGIVPEPVRVDREKRGFNASLNSLVDFDDPQTRAYLLEDSPLYEVVSRERIEPLLSSQALSNAHSKFLFNVINAKLFLEDR